jgi:hypothetical protein
MTYICDTSLVRFVIQAPTSLRRVFRSVSPATSLQSPSLVSCISCMLQYLDGRYDHSYRRMHRACAWCRKRRVFWWRLSKFPYPLSSSSTSLLLFYTSKGRVSSNDVNNGLDLIILHYTTHQWTGNTALTLLQSWHLSYDLDMSNINEILNNLQLGLLKPLFHLVFTPFKV